MEKKSNGFLSLENVKKEVKIYSESADLDEEKPDVVEKPDLEVNSELLEGKTETKKYICIDWKNPDYICDNPENIDNKATDFHISVKPNIMFCGGDRPQH